MSGFVNTSSDGGLEAFIAKLQGLADGSWREPVAEQAGAACVELVKQGFAESKAPDGTSWAPTLAGNQPLIGPTRALSESPAVEATDDGFELRVTDDKAIYHQATRPMLPEGQLPQAYSGAIGDAFRDYLEKLFT